MHKILTAFWVSLRRFHSSPINLERSGSERSAHPKISLCQLLREVGVKLTRVLSSECGPSVIIVEHVGGEWSLKLVPVGVFHHLLFRLLLLLFLRLCFVWAA